MFSKHALKETLKEILQTKITTPEETKMKDGQQKW